VGEGDRDAFGDCRAASGPSAPTGRPARLTRILLAALVAALPALAHAGDDLPLNPGVTPATIGETTCVLGWTKTVRPPVRFTNRIKVDLIRREGLPEESLVDFQLDHKIPLCLGGAPADPTNFQLQDWEEASQKDAVESCLCRAVCAGRVDLGEARRRIWADWREAGKLCE
jgi:hypothetical protein